MIFSEAQMREMIRYYLETKHLVANEVQAVNWSEREQGFVVVLEPKEGPIIRVKKKAEVLID